MKLPYPALRLLCVNDVYKPSQFSKLKTIINKSTNNSQTGITTTSILPDTQYENFDESKHQSKQMVTKLVMNGDFLGGSAFAAAQRGESIIDILNHLNVDYFTMGNHEFDYGAERVCELMKLSNFKWLGSNVRHTIDKKLFCGTYDTDTFEVPLHDFGNTSKALYNGIENGNSNGNGEHHNWSTTSNGNGEISNKKVKDSVLVGVFGLCTQDTPNLAYPGPSVIFEDTILHAKRCVTILKNKGCEYIIALTHVEMNKDKEIADIPGINLIIGGHEHTPFYLIHHNATIVKCGQNIDHLGILDLSFTRNHLGEIVTTNSFQLYPTDCVQYDHEIDTIIHKWDQFLPAKNEEILCHVGDFPVSTKSLELRSRETAFACMVADAICWSYRENSPFYSELHNHEAGMLVRWRW